MPSVEYRVSLRARRRHLYEIEATFPVVAGAREVELKLPVWTPGSYLIREYQRHLQDLTVTDGGSRVLAARKCDKASWRVVIPDGNVTQVRACYSIYAHELTVRTAHLDDHHAYWNGACLFLYVDGLCRQPVRLTVADVPPGWHVSTGLVADPAAPHRFLAASHDAIVDGPVEIGPHARLEFEAAGRPHELGICGRADYDRERLVADVTRIIEWQAALFGPGDVPYDRYCFLLHLVPGGYGGLEHLNSSSLIANPLAFQKPNKYLELLELISHEYFHLWNGKRIRPEALGPFGYQAEAHTRSLWVVEGWTSYYDRLTLRRTHLMTAARYLEKLGEELTKLAGIAGRRHQSLEESSWDAWIKLYRPDENTANSTVSYYLKGSIVSLLLDLEIRRRSGGERRFDDVLRAFWVEYGRAQRGYPDDAVQPLVERICGFSLDDFFAAAVRGRGELDLDGPLAHVGLRCQPPHAADGDDKPDKPEGGWLGANLAVERGRLRVTDVAEEGPAQTGGLSPGDEIVALDGWRVDDETLKDRLATSRPGRDARLTTFRREEQREVLVTLGHRPPHLEISHIPDANPGQRAAYQAWLGDPWPTEK